MEINGIPFDKAAACHSLALAYADGVYRSRIAEGKDPNIGPQEWLDHLFDVYVRAFGYLSEKSDEYIAVQLDNH